MELYVGMGRKLLSVGKGLGSDKLISSEHGLV